MTDPIRETTPPPATVPPRTIAPMDTPMDAEQVERLRAALDAPPTLEPGGPNSTIGDAERPSVNDGASMPHIPGYVGRSFIGAGAMGTVWEAIQLSTNRRVAVKLMPAWAAGSPDRQARFAREVELAARLEHPGIARVYDSGVADGAVYYAMERIRGASLETAAGLRGGTLRDRVALVCEVCDGVQYAHLNGVIHRDLKPGNILVDDEGRGTPKLLDFGLAIAVAQARDDAVRMTVSGGIAGTPAYMAPEQARGERQLDTRCDVYSLGVILFELLTGKLPHDMSGSLADVLRRISQDDARSPRRFEPRIDADLDAIILKALALNRDERYATAGELAADLRRWLSADIVLAQRQTTFYILRKRIHRHRWPVGLASASVLLSLAATVFYVVRVDQERRRADESAATATHALSQIRDRQESFLRLRNEMFFQTQRRLAARQADPSVRAIVLDMAQSIADETGDWQASPALVAQTRRTDALLPLQRGDVLAAAGQTAEAEAAYRDAIARFDAIRSSAEPTAAADRDAATSRIRLANLLLRGDRLADAGAALDEAETILETPPTRETMAERMTTRIARAHVAGRAGEHLSAARLLDEAISLVDRPIEGSEPGRMFRRATLDRFAVPGVEAPPSTCIADALATLPADRLDAPDASSDELNDAARLWLLSARYAEDRRLAASAAMRSIDLQRRLIARHGPTPDSRQRLAAALRRFAETTDDAAASRAADDEAGALSPPDPA